MGAAELKTVSSRLLWDGRQLAVALGAPGRRFRADPRCFAGEPVIGAWAHVCALTDESAKLPFDMPEVQQVRRDALAWWIRSSATLSSV